MGKAFIPPLTEAYGITIAHAREFAKATGNRRINPYDATGIIYGKRSKRKEAFALQVLWALVSLDMATYNSREGDFTVYG